MLQLISQLFSEISGWLDSSDGRSELYAWFLFSVIGGTTFSIVVFLSRVVRNGIRGRRRHYGCFGSFFIYFPELISGIDSKPRTSTLNLKRGWVVQGRAEQLDQSSNEILYDGTFVRQRDLIFVSLKSPVSKANKLIVLLSFQKLSNSDERISFGTMCSITKREEPYHVPVIVSERLLSPACLTESFRVFSEKASVTLDLRRQLIKLIESFPVGSIEDEFEHVNGRSGPQRLNQRSWSLFKSSRTK